MMAKRQKILGLPIGRRRRSRVPKMVAGGAALAAVPALVVPAVSKAGRTLSRGRQIANQATDIMDTATSMKQAVSGRRSTLGKVGAVISEVRKMGPDDGGGGRGTKLSHLIEQHTDVAVPRHVAYDQWTQFETFPGSMKGVETVHQRDNEKLEWTSKIGPSRRRWQAEIIEQVPDERIRWKSTGGAKHQGVVTFHALDDELTRILVQMEYDPTGLFEHTANHLRVQRRRAKRDLRLYKHFIELRGEETGAWRGGIDKKDDKKDKEDFAGQASQGGKK
jgi:hypothetical protein